MKPSEIREMTTLMLIYACTLASGLAYTVIIPVFPQIEQDLNTNILGVIEAGFIIVLTISVLSWGYQVDRISRRKLLAFSVLFYASCCLLISIFPPSLLSYLVLRLLMAMGLGAIMPVTYSVLGDLASYKQRGFFSSGLDIVVIMGSGLGIVLGAVAGPNSWRMAFAVVGAIGLLTIIPLMRLNFPPRGSSEPELHGVLTPETSSDQIYRVDFGQIGAILHKRTNLATFAQGTAALIPGVVFTYYLISLLSNQSKGGFGIDLGLATFLGLSFAFGRVVGYPFFGIIGDYFGRERRNGKAAVATVCMAVQCPFFLISFFFASLIDPNETSGKTELLWIFSQPYLLLFGLFFFLASFVGGGSGPNRRSLLYDINYPEHRGTTGALFYFSDQIGSAFGLFLGSLLLSQVNYLSAFTIVALFYLVAALFWTPAVLYANGESKAMRNEMQLRARQLRTKLASRKEISYNLN
ncbi:MAG: MFS transporter [Candidatus Hodarchaeales archaeon]|jgi:MFS family permease